MSDLSDNAKYKWTPESTTLLVSVWTDRQVQKQLEYTEKPQLIWESISKYMQKKGYEITARQCRSRMKQVLVCYKEAKKTGTHAGVERYYESIDKVLESKRVDKTKFNDNGIDTVDSVPVLLKSPPKEVKTNENLRMRHNKFMDAPISLTRHVEIFPRTWQSDREEYGDSSESNETVLARPHRSLSPVRNVGTSTVSGTMPLPRKSVRRSLPNDDRFPNENIENNRFAEIPLKTGVQNVHNQIIQENMMLRNQLAYDNIDMRHQPTDYRVNINHPGPRPTFHPENIVYHPNRIATNMVRMQSQLQQYSLDRNSAIPQEPRKYMNMGENATLNGNYKQYQRTYAETYPPDIAPNLDDAFCQMSKNTKIHNLNETYDQPIFIQNEMPCLNDVTTITNNATFNDDTLSIEFIEDSPSPTKNGAIETRTNSLDKRVTTPNAPFRKKKAQKLEQLMLNAITSQTEVFNKILATQDVMISRILDIDKDQQNRMENRLDKLLNVVQTTVMNNNGDTKECNAVAPSPPSPPLLNVPLCFSPPPKPGSVPPKLDLVPPKPCRVPCTNPSTHAQLVNQNPTQSRPDFIMPTRPGTIWTKLGPVSQSPFVKAQRQITAVTKAAEQWRTRSSAERRIASSVNTIMDPKTIIQETEKLLQSEKLMEARIENARRLSSVSERDQSARRKLFDPISLSQKTQAPVSNKQPSPAGLLSAAFLDIERQNEEKSRYSISRFDNDKMSDRDELLTGQGESYDRLRRLSYGIIPKNNIGNLVRDNNMNTSTPGKPNRGNIHDAHDDAGEPRQTIQQLAELVMNSARWRDAAAISANNKQIPLNHLQSNIREDAEILTRPPRETEAQRQSHNKALDWLQDPYSYGMRNQLYNSSADRAKSYPIGFTMGDIEDANAVKQTFDCPIGFTKDFISQCSRVPSNIELLDNERRMQHQCALMSDNGISAIQRDVAEQYAPDVRNRRLRTKTDDDYEDDEFLDTTTTLHPHRKPSLTSSGTSTGTGNILKSGAPSCILS